MKVLIFVLSLLLFSCILNKPKDGTNGTNGKDGNDGYNSLINTYISSASIITCQSGTAIILEVGMDKNKNNILDTEEIQKTEIICHGYNGTNGVDGKNAVLEIIDPCGASGGWDEVLLRMSNGQILAYFEDGNNRHLGLLIPGSYRTTDSQNCYFNITADNQIEY